MSELIHAPSAMRTCKQASKVLDMRDDWPRERFFQVYDRLLADSPYSSNEAVAEAANFSASNLSRWRNGKAKPTVELLRVLANTLGAPAWVLWEAAGVLPAGAAQKLDELTGEVSAAAAAVAVKEAAPEQVDLLVDLYRHLSPENQKRLVAQLEMAREWAESAIEKQNM